MTVRDAKLLPKRETWQIQTMWNILGSPIKQQGKAYCLESHLNKLVYRITSHFHYMENIYSVVFPLMVV